MTDKPKLWDQIKEVLEDKLQMSLLERVREVDANFEGNILTIYVANEDQLEFFSSELTRQRLTILARPIAEIEKIKVVEK